MGFFAATIDLGACLQASWVSRVAMLAIASSHRAVQCALVYAHGAGRRERYRLWQGSSAVRLSVGVQFFVTVPCLLGAMMKMVTQKARCLRGPMEVTRTIMRLAFAAGVGRCRSPALPPAVGVPSSHTGAALGIHFRGAAIGAPPGPRGPPRFQRGIGSGRSGFAALLFLVLLESALGRRRILSSSCLGGVRLVLKRLYLPSRGHCAGDFRSHRRWFAVGAAGVWTRRRCPDRPECCPDLARRLVRWNHHFRIGGGRGRGVCSRFLMSDATMAL